MIGSTRFGEVEVRDDAVLEFPDGLIGLPGTRYALLGDAPDSPFFWLHSVDHADVAVPVTNPWLFFDSTTRCACPTRTPHALELADPADARHPLRRPRRRSSSRTSPSISPRRSSLHTNNRLGRQIINDAHGYAVREPLFGEVELGDVQATTPRVPVAAQAR